MKRLWGWIRRDIRVQCICFIVPAAILVMAVAGYSVRSRFSKYVIDSLQHSEIQNAEMTASALKEKMSPILEKAYEQAINTDLLKLLLSSREERLTPGNSRYLKNCLSSAFNRVEEVNTGWIYIDEARASIYDKKTEARGTYRYIIKEEDTLSGLNDRVIQSGQAESAILRDESSDTVFFYAGCPIIGNIYGSYIGKEDVFAVLIIKVNFDMVCGSFDLFGNEYVSNTIVNREGIIAVSNDREKSGSTSKIPDDASTIIQELGFLGCQLYKTIDRQMIGEKSALVSTPVILEYVLLTVFLAAVSVAFINFIIRSLHPLEKTFEDISRGDFEKRVEVKGTDQISRIKAQFNHMLDEIVHLQKVNEAHRKKVAETIDMQRRAEIETLECQINSHFIFNSLSTIYYEIRDEGLDKPAAAITKLSNILRYAFNQKAQNVFLEQEIYWVEQYLSLHKERVGDSFHYEIEMDERIAFWPMCKLILQPFVENAILHGINDTSKNCYIQITAMPVDDNMIEIICFDNGQGISPEKQELVREVLKGETRPASFGIGLFNVALRIRKFFGPKACIDLNCDGSGTSFTLCLPKPDKNGTEHSLASLSDAVAVYEETGYETI